MEGYDLKVGESKVYGYSIKKKNKTHFFLSNTVLQYFFKQIITELPFSAKYFLGAVDISE